MDSTKLEVVLKVILEFARSNSQILALGLCGSWARGTANPDSDIDLLIVTKDKENFKKTTWIKELNFATIHDYIMHYEDQKYGRVWSRHVFLESGTEIEFSFADSSWADIEPLDIGTQKVISDGYRILYDPHQILEKLLEKVNSNL